MAHGCACGVKHLPVEAQLVICAPADNGNRVVSVLRPAPIHQNMEKDL